MKTKTATVKKRVTTEEVKRTLDVILELYTIVFLVALVVLGTFYVKGGYLEMAKSKHDVFLWCCRGYFYGAVPLAFLSRLFSREKWRLSITDILMLSFFVTLFLAYIFTPWQPEAWTGYPGWYMGFRTWTFCVGIYFFTSRALRDRRSTRVVLAVCVAASALAFLWGTSDSIVTKIWPGDEGISHRIIDLPGLSEMGTDRVAPMGNVDWYGGYYSVFFPLTLGLLFLVKKNWQRIALLVASAIGIAFGFLEEAQSTYIVLLTCIPAVWWMCFWFMKGELTRKKRFIRFLPIGAALFLGVIVILLIVINTLYPGSIGPLSKYGFFTFDLNWGTLRGTTFRASINTFKELFFTYKAVGVGEDCFTYAVYGIEEVKNLLNSVYGEGTILSCAHNELMSMLINAGIFGTATFYGTMLYSGIAGMKESDQEGRRIFFVLAVPIFAYILHNMVSFCTTENTPYLFLVMGLLENYRNYFKYHWESSLSVIKLPVHFSRDGNARAV